MNSSKSTHEQNSNRLNGEEVYENYYTSLEEEVDDQSSLSSIVTGAKSVASEVFSYWGKKFYDSFISRQSPQAHYKHLLEVAENYSEWAEAATKLDQLQGNDKWKNDPNSPDYDHDLLEARYNQLKRARKSYDPTSMILLLRTSLSRNLGDMGQPKLYAHSHIGTKNLIERYINEVVKQMNIICEAETLTTREKLEFITNTRQSFGRTALLLSGGATFGLTHLGVIKCLHENKLLPRIISGASSGSIMAALVCTKTDAEIPHVLSNSSSLDLEVFERSSDPDTWLRRLTRLLKHGVLFDIDILRECMRRNIGDMTFQEAYNRTRRILNITVSSSTVYEMPRLLNYLTAPNVIIWSAVAASCSVPLVYSSAPLMAKDNTGKVVLWNPSGHRWIDGSVENDLPMNKLSELFNVNHFIVCQVNPHVIPFLQTNLVPTAINRIVGWFLFLAISELQHRLTQLSELGIMRSLIYRLQAMMSQRYYGDITIVPHISYTDFLNLLSNPSPQLVKGAMLRGERATWPKISIIRNHCQIELTLDEIMYRLRSSSLNDSLVTRNPAGVHDLDIETHPGNLSDGSSVGGKRTPRPKPPSISSVDSTNDTTVVLTKNTIPSNLAFSKLENELN